MAPLMELTVTDVKQHAYCSRIPYYHYVQPVNVAPTYKMKRGHDVQAAVEALEGRRKLLRYGLAEGERLFGRRLHSERLGLTGHVDLIIKTSEAAWPVDFKDTEGPPRSNHRAQLAAYALLIEDVLGWPSPAGFVYLVPRQQAVMVELGERQREGVLSALAAIRAAVASESMPDPTPFEARCVACEFRNFCADVW